MLSSSGTETSPGSGWSRWTSGAAPRVTASLDKRLHQKLPPGAYACRVNQDTNWSQPSLTVVDLEITPVMIKILPDGLPAAFQVAEAAHAQAVMLHTDDEFAVNDSRIAELAMANRLPVLSFHRADAKAGALVEAPGGRRAPDLKCRGDSAQHARRVHPGRARPRGGAVAG